MKLFVNKEDCCGCTACMNICSNESISMLADDEGFLYPFIDETLCVNCGMCKSVCPFHNKIVTKGRLKEPQVYALKHKDDNIRMLSSSGGVYTAISDFVMAGDGMGLSMVNSINNAPNLTDKGTNVNCYGAAFDPDFNVHHKVATTAFERDQFRGSKYVQSYLGSIFIEIKQNLIDGKIVLFTGTPCQTAGLSKYLNVSNINTSYLVLNDIICHGTPSPKIWNEYKCFVENKVKSKLKSYTFRYKKKGGRGYNVRTEFENGKIRLNTSEVKTYVRIFSSNLALRPSCYNCKFANLKRPSDITIGDFVGIEECLPEFVDVENGVPKGVSLVLVNTLKGQAIFEQIKDKVLFEQSNTIDCLQHNLKEPTKCPPRRGQFWQDYYKSGFNYVARKYAGYGLASRLKRNISIILRRIGISSKFKKVLQRINT